VLEVDGTRRAISPAPRTAARATSCRGRTAVEHLTALPARTDPDGLPFHTRDVFSEMRKAAARFPETAHLGPGCDIFTARVVLATDVQSNGAAYWTGSPSHWHQDLDEGGRRFTTEAEAQSFLSTAPQPEPIYFGEQLARFEWRLTRQAIEHREKYSMGHGYYLKAACRYHSGWIVRKVSPGHIGSAVELDVLAEATRPEPTASSEQPAAGVTLNAERQGVEIRFPAKPPAAVLDRLKANGWRWSRFSACWYQRDTPEARAFAARLTEAADT
jgi:hypothetical protein